MNPTIDPEEASHSSPVERRRIPRARLVTELSLYSGSNFYAGFTEDISEGGVFVASYAMLPVGAQVAIELALPGGFEIRATGTVRWLRGSADEVEGSEPPGMGVELSAIAEEDRLLIREFVQNRQPYFFDRSDE
jgi:uncharacterized protein (TIGR02266 family)